MIGLLLDLARSSAVTVVKSTVASYLLLRRNKPAIEIYVSRLLLQSSSLQTVICYSMSAMNAKWTRLASSARLRRSSQTLSVVKNQAWIFGGELQPRQPIDNQIDVVELSESKYEE